MAISNKFPPDMPKGWDETEDEIERAGEGLKAKASGVADTVKDGYYRAKDAVGDMDAGEAARSAGRYAQEGGEAAMRAVERHPLVVFGLGALSVGLIAWASMRPSTPAWQPDYPRLRRLFSDYGGDDAVKAGESAWKNGESWLRSSGSVAQDYARDGGRLLAKRTEREPLAALLGVGIAIYVLGSLLSSNSEPAPTPARRRNAKR
ncbi:hypothetical protein [Bosea sp. (in: a-proteobacteria)]|jgi:hypothetical protein|uniref:hypothetical protein n=1 Tax=Bosea sp. (in: a-proteobacteria) TaxID=1871050 RepID=UPI003F727801